MSEPTPQESRLYLCADCGGSKTAVALCNSNGETLARGFAGPSNYYDVGPELFVERVKEAALKAMVAANLLPGNSDEVALTSRPWFYAIWVGASGVDRPQAIESVTPGLSQAFHVPRGPRLAITNDTSLLASPLQSFPEADTAIAIIAGTGSNICSFRKAPEGGLSPLSRMGGWGWILGDEGSGVQVGRETMQWVLRTADQESVTGSSIAKGRSLRDKVLAHYGLENPYDLFGVVYGVEPDESIKGKGKHGEVLAYLHMEPKQRISCVTPVVFKAAFEEGDQEAMDILRITSQAITTRIRWIMAAPATDPARHVAASKTVLCFGGSLVGVKEYRSMVIEDLQKDGHVFAGSAFVDDITASGAAALAKQFGGDA